ncbi:hypothetical protein CCP3SC1_230023 [Gammaproteobacteria bacterium]
MMRFRFLMAFLFLVLIIPVRGNSAESRTFLYDKTYLQASKDAWQSGAPWANIAMTSLQASADRKLLGDSYSVTKTFGLISVPGATPHDFISIGAYFWPNPKTANGLPYIKRPGHVNPNSGGSLSQFGKVSIAIHRLGLMYFFTENEVYAERAAELVRIFFIRSETRMNPNSRFGKVIPGVSMEGGFVVAGMSNYFRLLYEGLGLIEASPHWRRANKLAMQQWSSRFLDWMEFSVAGRKEFRNPGNHGSNYDLLGALLSMYIDDTAGAKRYVRHYLTRIPVQFAADGTQPLEMPHANNFMYSVYNLKVAADIADIGKRLGIDVWNFSTADGRGIRKSIDFLTPYMKGVASWTSWPGEAFARTPARYHALLQQAALGFCDPNLLHAADSLGHKYAKYFVNLTHPQTILSNCHAVTSTVIISGSAQRGQTSTASNDLSDTDGGLND